MFFNVAELTVEVSQYVGCCCAYMYVQHTNFEGGGKIPPLALCTKNPGLHIIVVGRCVKLMRLDNWVMCANPQMHGEVNDTCTSTKLEVWTVYTAYVYGITH